MEVSACPERLFGMVGNALTPLVPGVRAAGKTSILPWQPDRDRIVPWQAAYYLLRLGNRPG